MTEKNNKCAEQSDERTVEWIISSCCKVYVSIADKGRTDSGLPLRSADRISKRHGEVAIKIAMVNGVQMAIADATVDGQVKRTRIGSCLATREFRNLAPLVSW